MNSYREMAPVPPCWCRKLPPGYLFYGWADEDQSVSYQEMRRKPNYTHLKVEHWSHTSDCLKERQDRKLTEIFSWFANINLGPPPGTPGLWRWKTKPLLGCYFLQHTWQTIRERRGQAGDYDVKVCQCGAEKIISWPGFPSFGDMYWEGKNPFNATVYRKWSAWFYLRDSFAAHFTWQAWYNLRFGIRGDKPAEYHGNNYDE